MAAKMWAGAIGAGALLVTAAAFAPAVPTEVVVTGTEYAFVGVPVSVGAGEVSFIFKNAGKVRHEMAITRVKAGVSAEDALNAMKNGGRRRDYVDGAAVLVVAAPGEESSRARLVLDVRKGETYLVSCTLKDSAAAPPHLMLGMYTSFRVE